MGTSSDAAPSGTPSEVHLQAPSTPQDRRSTDQVDTATSDSPRPPSQTSAESNDAQCFPSAFSVNNPSHPPTRRKNPMVTAVVRNLTSSTLGADLGLSTHMDRPPTWQPTLLRAFPLLGVGALVVAICCVFVSLGILVGSNGKATEDWQWPPSVFLAIFSAIVNRVVQFALVQALPIAWWYKAWSGATVEELQRRWEAGEGLLRAVKNARREWALAFATIMVTLVAVDGPFLQKASSIRTSQQTRPVTLHVPISPELPTGFSGRFEGGVLTYSTVFEAFQGFLDNTTVPANVTGCRHGTCRTKVRGPGVVTQNCSSKIWPLTRDTLLHNKTAAWGPRGNMPLFTIGFNHSSMFNNYTGPEAIQVLVGRANYIDCNGAFTQKRCTLVSAILDYDVEVIHNKNDSSNRIGFAGPISEAKFVDFANNTDVDASKKIIPLTLIPIATFISGEVFVNASMHRAFDPRDAAVNMPEAASFNAIAQKYTVNGSMCDRSFRDPTEDIVADFNNIMFRAAITAATFSNTSSGIDKGLEINQTVLGEESRTLNVFRSDLRWFAGAATLEILAILAVLPVYFGWWKLGIRVTMSPLELAKAFEAPVLEKANSGAGSRGIVREIGQVKLALGLAETKTVDERLGKEFTRSRLVIGEQSKVVRPRKDWRFEE